MCEFVVFVFRLVLWVVLLLYPDFIVVTPIEVEFPLYDCTTIILHSSLEKSVTPSRSLG